MSQSGRTSSAATAKSSLLTQPQKIRQTDRPLFLETAIPPQPPPHGDPADDNESRWRRRATISLAYLPAKTHGWPWQNGTVVGEASIDPDPGRPAATLPVTIEALT
jgi:hypothetical protein